MNINIKATNIELTENISNYASKRFAVIERFFKNDSTALANIELGKTSAHHKNGEIFRAEIHIVAKEKDLYASAEDVDLYLAIDAVRDEMLRKIRSLKAKKISVLRRSGAKVKDVLKGILPNKKNK